jgi:three-Cys-motif partner protein
LIANVFGLKYILPKVCIQSQIARAFFLPLTNRKFLKESTPSSFSADDFTVTAVEPWFKVKVQAIYDLMQAFTSQTTGVADEIIFIDLSAGSGFYATGFQKQLIPMPALEALRCDPPFTKFVFCEHNPEAAKALKVRVNKYYRGRNVVLFEDTPELTLEKLRLYVPPTKKGYKVAALCLIDLFSFEFSFALIERFAAMGYSFVIPYTFQLNNRMDFRHYLKNDSDRLLKFLGHNTTSIQTVKSNNEFYKRVVRIHQNNMLTLGLNVSLSAHKIESKLMDIPAFYMGMYSKQLSAKAIVQQAKENSQQQFELF